MSPMETAATSGDGNADVAFYDMPWMTIELLLDAMDSYNTALVEFSGARGIPMIRERESIPTDQDHFVDCMHLADKGSAKMAERWARFLIEEGIVAKAYSYTYSYTRIPLSRRLTEDSLTSDL